MNRSTPRRRLARLAWIAFAAVAIVPLQAAEPPRLVVQTGQSGTRVADWSPDGRWIVTAGSDGRLLLWDAESGRQLRQWVGPPSGITAVRFAHDGRTVLAGTSGGTLHAVDLVSGKGSETATGGLSVHALDLSAKDAVMVIASGHLAATVDTRTGKAGVVDVQPYSLSAIAVSADGSRAAAARSDGAILVFDVSTSTVEHTLRAAEHAPAGTGRSTREVVRTLAFAPDGRRLASGSMDGTVHLWDPSTGALLHTLEGHGITVASVDFSPDGHHLLVGGGGATLWDVRSGQRVGEALPTRHLVEQARYSVDGRRLLAVDPAGATVFDAASREVLRDLRGYAGSASRLRFSPDGARLLVDGTVWDLATGRDQASPAHGGGHEGFAHWTADGSRLFGAGMRGIGLWDARTGELRLSIDDGQDTLMHGALSGDGAWIAAGNNDGQVRLWDGRSGELKKTLQVNDHAVRQVAFSRDGTLLAAGGGDRPVTLWDIRSGRQLWAADVPHGRFEFMPDGQRIALFGAGPVAYRDVRTGRAAGLGPDHGAWVRALRVSADGRWLATGGADRAVKVWDLASGALLATLAGHEDAISDVDFSPDGALVASAAGDGTVRLWRRASGEPLAQLVHLVGREGWVSNGVVIGPGGRFDAPDLEALDGLHWILPSDPDRAVPVEAFMRQYYEPRLLPRLLAGDALPPLPEIGGLDTRAPSLRIVEVVPDPTDARRVEVVLEVDGLGPEGPGAFDVRLFRNGQRVGAADGPVRGEAGTGRARLRFPVRLGDEQARAGARFSAYAFNRDRVKSPTVTAWHRGDGEWRVARRRAFLVNIGIDQYQSPAWDLEYAANDARLLGSALAERLRASGRFDEVVQTLLVSDAETPGGATRDAIAQALAALSPAVAGDAAPGPDDVVIVSFAGHGAVSGDGQFHLLPHDIGDVASRLLTPAVLQRGIDTDTLGRWFGGIDAGQVALILDACHSAASVAEPGFKPGPMGSRGLGQLAYDKGLRILAATQPSDVALESDATEHGLLSYALVKEGLGQGRADFLPRDERILLDEWLDFAVQRVPALSAEVAGGQLDTRGASVRARNAGSLATPAQARGLQRPALFDFRIRSPGATATDAVELGTR